MLLVQSRTMVFQEAYAKSAQHMQLHCGGLIMSISRAMQSSLSGLGGQNNVIKATV